MVVRLPTALFADGELRQVLTGRVHTMRQRVAAYPDNQLLNTAPEALADAMVEEFSVAPLQLHKEQATQEVYETTLDARHLPDRDVFDRSRPVPIPSTGVRVRVPFTGDSNLFTLRASTFSVRAAYGRVEQTCLVLERTWAGSPAPEQVQRWFEEEWSHLVQEASYHVPEVQQHNDALRGLAQAEIDRRRSHLLAARNLASALPFKMHERSDAPLTFAPGGIQKRRLVLTPPTGAAVRPFAPEPALNAEQYDGILATIRAMGHSMERDPAAYGAMEEEHLRSVLLTALNAQFEGGATGETFNASGKTDILVREQDRNIFTGECKIWGGPKTLSDAIGQVLGYLAWRDTKAAVIMFVRRKDFTSVLDKIPAAVEAHALHRASLGRNGESEWRYRFAQPNDPNREVTLAIMAYHLPA